MKTTLLTAATYVALSVTGVVWGEGDEAQEHAKARANLPKAKVTLAQAVETASKAIPAGKVVEAELKSENDGLLFEVEIVTGKIHQEVEIDAMTGKIIKTEVEDQAGEDQEQEELETEAAATAKFSVAKAIDAALKEVKASKAFEANFEREDGKLLICVEVVAGKAIKEVEFDAMTGKLIGVDDEDDD
jgi:uncharacterized membrane protein YkoI